VWAPQVPLLKSVDGGKTFGRVKGPHHGDHHDIWIDPKNPKRIIDSNDGGVDISTNGGETWYAPPLPLGQFYHISVDNRTPYWVSGTMQDIGTAQGPSNSLTTNGIPFTAWHPVGGGEAGHTASDPTDPNIVYATEYMGYLTRYDHRTRQALSIGIYPYNASGHGAKDLKYRFQWTAPVMVSRFDRTVYHAANVLFATKNDGKKWEKISGDLTRNDRTKQNWSGGPITGDNTGVEVYGTIFAIAESPKKQGLLWAGSDDGLVHVRDGKETKWENVTPGLKKAGLPEWATVMCIEPSPFDASTAYVVASAHRLDDRKPYLFKTTNRGGTWKNLTGKMPEDGYLNVVREDPKRKGMLYVGTERGIVFSRDDGTTWERLKLNLPTVRVTDMVVKDDDLVVGTNGRSIWILDDLTPLRRATPAALAKDVHLFPARPVVRYRLGPTIWDKAPLGAGDNPPSGAIVHYHLKAAPKGEITLEVLDEKGKLVNQLSSKKEGQELEDLGAYSDSRPKQTLLPTKAGLHRVVWDLRYKGAETIHGARVDSGQPALGPLVNPGTYTLKLTVEGKTVEAKLKVLRDPRTVAPEVDAIRRVARLKFVRLLPPPVDVHLGEDERENAKVLEAQRKLALQLRDDITRLTITVEKLRSVRQQILARNELIDGPKAAPLVEASKALVKKLDALEQKLHNPKARVSYDILAQKGGAQLYSQLVWLFELIKDADGEPTQGLREVYAEQAALLKKYEAQWQTIVKEDVRQLNDTARKLDLPGIIVPTKIKKKPGEPERGRRRPRSSRVFLQKPTNSAQVGARSPFLVGRRGTTARPGPIQKREVSPIPGLRLIRLGAVT
jgi:hypothetical protein